MVDPRPASDGTGTDPRSFIGWFDDPSQTKPVHDPPHDAKCPVCVKPITPDDVRTICLMWADRKGGKSVFYRMHRTCAVSLSDREKQVFDGMVLDAMPTLFPPES